MLKTLQHRNLKMVDLSTNVSVFTAIAQENHAALRSGFAGCPANPRWNVSKFHAWKTGRQLRTDLAQGRMVVRSHDGMLVPVTGQEESLDDKPPSTASRKSKGKSHKAKRGNLFMPIVLTISIKNIQCGVA